MNFCCSKQTAILKLHFVESLLQINPGLFVLFVEFRKSIHFEMLAKNTCDLDRGKMWSVTESVDVSCNTKILQIKIYFLTNEKPGVLLKGIVALISNGYERQRI